MFGKKRIKVESKKNFFLVIAVTDKGNFIVEYTTKDIMAKLDAQHKLLDKIHSQVKETNGRVTSLERTSIGRWMSRHVWQSFVILSIVVMLFVSDFRHPLIEFFLKFI